MALEEVFVNASDPVERVKRDEDRIIVTEINRSFVNRMENIPLRRRVVWHQVLPPLYNCPQPDRH